MAENAVCVLLRDPAQLLRDIATRRAKRGERGRQDATALRYCCAVAFFEVSDFQQLPHRAITPQYVCSSLTVARQRMHDSSAETKKLCIVDN
jgi:hypothetical protein